MALASALAYSCRCREAAAVVESGSDAGDAVAIRRRLCGGEGPVGMHGGGGLSTSSGAARLEPSTLPVGDLSATQRRLDGLWQGLLAAERHSRSLCQRARAPHAYFAAPVRGRRAA